MPAEIVRALFVAPDTKVEGLIGSHLDDRHYLASQVIRGRDVNVVDPVGCLLMALRVRRLLSADLRLAWPALWKAARPTYRRVTASGGAEEFRSGAAGYLNEKPLSFNRHPSWPDLFPLIHAVEHHYRRELPMRHAVHKIAVSLAGLRTVTPWTVFTTVQANAWAPERGVNARMAVHPDKGNLPATMSAIVVIPSGQYEGGLLVFPRYGVAADLRAGDVMFFHGHEPHGNTALVGPGARLSLVLYSHGRPRRDG